MPMPRFASLLRMLLMATAVAPASVPALAQMAVIDPSNLIQNALTATRTLQQINNQIAQITNQIRSLENEARNLTSLGQRVEIVVAKGRSRTFHNVAIPLRIANRE